MKTDLEELVETADRLCSSLDKAASNERQFNIQVCIQLERMSWETLRVANDLREITEYMRGFG
jgi:hypothetical protein